MGSCSVFPSNPGIIDRLFSLCDVSLWYIHRPIQTRVWWPTSKGGNKGKRPSLGQNVDSVRGGTAG